VSPATAGVLVDPTTPSTRHTSCNAPAFSTEIVVSSGAVRVFDQSAPYDVQHAEVSDATATASAVIRARGRREVTGRRYTPPTDHARVRGAIREEACRICRWHPDLDQFIRVESGRGRLDLGTGQDRVDEKHDVEDDWAMIIPAGTWHNVVNTGDDDLKLYSLYSPPEHPDGTVHVTKAEADAAEHH
jgi:mannose-6-phosphate isomerase-like protein (cupin superfamily)